MCLDARQCEESVSVNSRITLRGPESSQEAQLSSQLTVTQRQMPRYLNPSCSPSLHAPPPPPPPPKHVYLKSCKHKFNIWISNSKVCLQLLHLRLKWSKSNPLSPTKETYKLFQDGTFLLQFPHTKYTHTDTHTPLLEHSYKGRI